MSPVTRFARAVSPPIAVGIVVAFVAGCAAPPASAERARDPAAEPLARTADASATPAWTPGVDIAIGLPPAPSPSAIPSPAVDPSRTPAPTAPTAQPRPFAMDLYRRGDFVSQETAEWCVPAAIQTMANVIERGRARGLPTQRRLDAISRSLSSPRLVGPGSEPEGWADTLDRLGYGPYAVVAKRTREQALRAAARAIRLTRRPVGLLVWRGAHAWVMTGFEATADPARTGDFRVTAVRVSDPWYPRAVGAWGRTRGPDARIALARLAEVYLRWRRPLARYAELDGRFVLVMPVRDDALDPAG